MSGILARIACLAFALASLPAMANFHLWQITQLYSNADGTIQFIELTAATGGQQFMAGHDITADGVRVFTFPSNLPGDTTGKKMLLGTAGFAALNLVAPDYVIPSGFLAAPSGSLNFSGGFDVWNYTGVPVTDNRALFRNGSVGQRAPTNFAGATINPPRLANISTRMQVLTGDDVMIGGFVIGGPDGKTVVVRARGPSLIAAGVANAIADPQLQLFGGQTQLGFNDNHGDAANAAQLQASGFAPANASEAAILTTLLPGAYTAIVSGVGQTTGVGIVEVFEVNGAEIPLVNIATRGRVLTGEDVMIAGFIIQGNGPQMVMVRARGPSLTQFGVPGALADPQLQLFSGQTVVASNDDWETDCPPMSACAATIQANGLATSDPRESVILTTLNPGAYSAVVTGVGATTGVAIVEVFKVN